VKPRATSGADLVAMEDRRLQQQLSHERDMNRVFERRCPGVKVTDQYQRGACPPQTFYTEADRLHYLIKREHAKFNPAVRLTPHCVRSMCGQRPTTTTCTRTGGKRHGAT